jgi:hypothetical protein
MSETDYDDKAVADFYENPANREPIGPPERRTWTGHPTRHVPIRFNAETIEHVKQLAEHDGLTVSSWIRQVVEREVERRRPRETETSLWLGEVRLVTSSVPDVLRPAKIANEFFRRDSEADP